MSRNGKKTQRFCSIQCGDNGRSKPTEVPKRRRPKETRSCPVCKKDFIFRSTPSGTIKKAGTYCSKKCLYISMRQPKRQCETCGKEFQPAFNTSKQFCSKACRPPRKKTGQNVPCEFCGKVIYIPKCRTKKTKYFFCSNEHQRAWQGRNKVDFTCKVCRKPFRWSLSYTTKNTPKYCSIKCRDKDPETIQRLRVMNLKQQEVSPNKLEIIGYKLLKDIGVIFEPQKLIADKFLVDAYLSEYNIIVQFDGDYWHANPTKYQTLDHRQAKRVIIDKSQNAYFTKCGYTILRFWESDIKKRPTWVCEQITNSINLKS